MDNVKLASHESLHLHDILTFKNLCLTKSVTMKPLATDEELKKIIKLDAVNNERHIKELKSIMENSNDVLK